MKYCRAFYKSLVIHVCNEFKFKSFFAGVLIKIAGASLQFSTKNFECDTVFIWIGSSTNMFDVKITKDSNQDPWNKTNNSEFRVNDTLLYL